MWRSRSGVRLSTKKKAKRLTQRELLALSHTLRMYSKTGVFDTAMCSTRAKACARVLAKQRKKSLQKTINGINNQIVKNNERNNVPTDRVKKIYSKMLAEDS